jgi:regulator of chromosome condensation
MFGYDGGDGKLVQIQHTPVLMQKLEKIVQIACGANHALVLDAGGVVWAWGCGEQNQLGRRVLGRQSMGSLIPHPIEVKSRQVHRVRGVPPLCS